MNFQTPFFKTFGIFIFFVIFNWKLVYWLKTCWSWQVWSFIRLLNPDKKLWLIKSCVIFFAPPDIRYYTSILMILECFFLSNISHFLRVIIEIVDYGHNCFLHTIMIFRWEFFFFLSVHLLRKRRLLYMQKYIHSIIMISTR